MIRHPLIACLIVLVQGCTVLNPDHLIRVTEFRGKVEPPVLGSPVEGKVDATGCQVSSKGEVKGCFTYKSKVCTFQSSACP